MRRKKGGPAFLPGSFSQGLEVGFHVFPGNLLIGRVDSVERSNADSSYYAILTPYVDVTEVTDVFVVTDFDGKGDVTTGLPETNNKDEEDPAQTASKGNE